jgi:hypothetical protein
VLLFIVVIFFLIYGVEVFFKVRCHKVQTATWSYLNHLVLSYFNLTLWQQVTHMRQLWLFLYDPVGFFFISFTFFMCCVKKLNPVIYRGFADCTGNFILAPEG